MVRTIISLNPDEKAWLDKVARKEHTSMAEVIRKAIRKYRQITEQQENSFEDLLKKTSGIWPGEDGLRYQTKLRDEWK